MDVPVGGHVHDPFSGAGTTAIECSLEGYVSTCVEINPFLHFVNRVCLDWRLDEGKLLEHLGTIRQSFADSQTLQLADLEAAG